MEWASARTSRGRAAKELLAGVNADVLCITEGSRGILPASGHVVEATADYGYGITQRRKVLLWSQRPWEDIDTLGDPRLPGGRFASCVVELEGLRLRIIGVGVPWRDAHVRSGRKDRLPWEDRLAYLNALRDVIASTNDLPLVVCGDFNQRLPPRGVPGHVADALAATLSTLEVATARHVDPVGRQLIDHMAHSPTLVVRSVLSFDRTAPDGRVLSDHDGVVVELDGAPSAEGVR